MPIFEESIKVGRINNDKLDILYKKLWGEDIIIEDIPEGSEIDKEGTDKIIKVGNKSIKIQEKKRQKDYGDFLLEIEHIFGDGRVKKGWFYKTDADYLVYYIIPTDRIYLIGMANLRNWVENHTIFIDSLPWRESWNPKGNYTTRNKAIPWGLLLKEKVAVLFED